MLLGFKIPICTASCTALSRAIYKPDEVRTLNDIFKINTLMVFINDDSVAAT